jgi:hypothetical protein
MTVCSQHSAWRGAAALAGFLLLASMRCPAAAPPSDAELKAVLVFHLTQYVTWPASSTNQSREFLIGILGPDPLGPALDEVVKGEMVGGRPVRVVRRSRARDLVDCPLVYISPQARERLPRIFAELRQLPGLTVGESSDFLEEGGMIRFRKTPDRRVRVQVDLQHARENGFSISAQLLRVADVVQGGGK